MAEPILTKFVVGETSFLSRGVSKIKMIIDGKETVVPIPIRSISLIELRQELARNEPQPKEKLVVVKKDTVQGKAMGLEEDTAVLALDYADPEYRKRLDAHGQEMTWRTIAQAVDMEFVDKDGNVITDIERKIDALKMSNLSGHQIDQILTDIASLTKRREARADFLSGTASV